MLWWNLRDGWPIISDSVVDYYFGKKRAYGVLRDLQRPQLVQLCDGAVRGLIAVNDRRHSVTGHIIARDAESRRILFDRDVELPSNAAVKLMDYPALEGRGMVQVEYSFEGERRINHCLYGEPPFDYGDYLRWTQHE